MAAWSAYAPMGLDSDRGHSVFRIPSRGVLSPVGMRPPVVEREDPRVDDLADAGRGVGESAGFHRATARGTDRFRSERPSPIGGAGRRASGVSGSEKPVKGAA